MADKKTTAKKEPLKDSDGLRVSSIQTEVVEEEPKKSAVKEAFEAEVAADEAAHDAEVTAEFNKFLAERG